MLIPNGIINEDQDDAEKDTPLRMTAMSRTA